MSRHPAILLYCDHHEVNLGERHVPGETVMVLAPGKGICEFELCAECSDPETGISYGAAVALAQEVGREPERLQPPKRGRPKRSASHSASWDWNTAYHDETDLSCPEGCRNGKPYTSLKGKRQHMTNAHGSLAREHGWAP